MFDFFEKYHYMDYSRWTYWPKIELDICKPLKQKIFSNVPTSSTSYSLQKTNFIKCIQNQLLMVEKNIKY